MHVYTYVHICIHRNLHTKQPYSIFSTQTRGKPRRTSTFVIWARGRVFSQSWTPNFISLCPQHKRGPRHLCRSMTSPMFLCFKSSYPKTMHAHACISTATCVHAHSGIYVIASHDSMCYLPSGKHGLFCQPKCQGS